MNTFGRVFIILGLESKLRELLVKEGIPTTHSDTDYTISG